MLNIHLIRQDQEYLLRSLRKNSTHVKKYFYNIRNKNLCLVVDEVLAYDKKLIDIETENKSLSDQRKLYIKQIEAEKQLGRSDDFTIQALETFDKNEESSGRAAKLAQAIQARDLCLVTLMNSIPPCA